MANTLREVVQLTDFDTQELKDKYLRMTELFEMALPDSLECDQFALEELMGSSEFRHPDWNEFLNVPQVSIWIEAQTYNRVKAKARKAQSHMDVSNAQSAKAIMSIVEKREGEETKKIVLTRLPEKDYENS